MGEKPRLALLVALVVGGLAVLAVGRQGLAQVASYSFTGLLLVSVVCVAWVTTTVSLGVTAAVQRGLMRSSSPARPITAQAPTPAPAHGSRCTCPDVMVADRAGVIVARPRCGTR